MEFLLEYYFKDIFEMPMKDFLTKKYFVYLFRWLISAFVMMPFMVFFEYLGITLTLNLILGQIIGSLIFFKIDDFIFKKL